MCSSDLNVCGGTNADSSRWWADVVIAGVEFFGVGSTVAAGQSVSADDVGIDPAECGAVFVAGAAVEFCVCESVFSGVGGSAVLVAATDKAGVKAGVEVKARV